MSNTQYTPPALYIAEHVHGWTEGDPITTTAQGSSEAAALFALGSKLAEEYQMDSSFFHAAAEVMDGETDDEGWTHQEDFSTPESNFHLRVRPLTDPVAIVTECMENTPNDHPEAAALKLRAQAIRASAGRTPPPLREE